MGSEPINVIWKAVVSAVVLVVLVLVVWVFRGWRRDRRIMAAYDEAGRIFRAQVSGEPTVVPVTGADYPPTEYRRRKKHLYLLGLPFLVGWARDHPRAAGSFTASLIAAGIVVYGILHAVQPPDGEALIPMPVPRRTVRVTAAPLPTAVGVPTLPAKPAGPGRTPDATSQLGHGTRTVVEVAETMPAPRTRAPSTRPTTRPPSTRTSKPPGTTRPGTPPPTRRTVRPTATVTVSVPPPRTEEACLLALRLKLPHLADAELRLLCRARAHGDGYASGTW